MAKNSMKIFTLLLFVFCTNNCYNCAPTNSDIDTNIDNYNNNENPNENGYMAAEKIIDINNPDAGDMANLQSLNISLAVLRQRQLQLQLLNGDGTTTNYNDQPAPIIRINENHMNAPRKRNQSDVTSNGELALDAIKRTIEASILRDSTNEHPLEATSSDLEHYTAAHEICEIPKNTNTSAWNTGNTWNLYFLPPNHGNVLMTLAVLRLYKKEFPLLKQNDSDFRPDDLLRITVSVYLKKKRRERKRLCSSIMISRNYTGWIEFDIKTAVKLWDNPNRNLGLAVDVDDQDETPLKASTYFYPSQCQASGLAFPWSFYHNSSNMDQMDSIPRYPRIDVEYRGIPTHIPSPTVRPALYYNPFLTHYGYQMDGQDNNSEVASTPQEQQVTSTDRVLRKRHLHHRHHHNHNHHSHTNENRKSEESS